MNLAVVGSRDWPYPNAVGSVLLDVLTEVERHDLVIVSGGARGVDSLATAFAGDFNLPDPIVHRPDWRPNGVYDRAAGFKRNRLIVADADFMLAFQYRGSAGTQNSIDLALNAGVPVVVFSREGE